MLIGTWEPDTVLSSSSLLLFVSRLPIVCLTELIVDLQLAVKTSPDAYDFDADAWFPVAKAAAVQKPAKVQKPVAEKS